MLGSDEPKSVAPHIWQLPAAREAVGFTLLLLLIFAAYRLRTIFTPVVLALLVAYLIHPVIKFIEIRTGIKPSLIVALLLVINFAIFTSIGFWIGPILGLQIRSIIVGQPVYTAAVKQQVDGWFQLFGIGYEASDFFQLAMSETGRFVNVASRLAGNIGDIFLAFTIWLICFFAFASKSSKIKPYLAQWIPNSMKKIFDEIILILDRAFAGFFRGRVVIALVNVVLFSLAWKVTHVSFWLLFGILAALFNIVPYLSIVVWLIAIIVNFGEALIRVEPLNTFSIFIWPTVAFATVHFIEGWLLTPLIQSKKVNLSTPTILIAIAIGGMTGGVAGLLLAVPITASIKMLAEKYFLENNL